MVTDDVVTGEARASQPRPDDLWEQITADFREACLLRREGRQREADYILNCELPRVINDWSRVTTRKAEKKRAQLLAMFAEEQRRVDSAVAIQRILADRFMKNLVSTITAKVADEVKGVVTQQIASLTDALSDSSNPRKPRPLPPPHPERVSFDDIPGAIDAVLAEQRRGERLGAPLSNPPARPVREVVSPVGREWEPWDGLG